MASISKNQIISLGGLPNAPLVIKKRGRRYLSLPIAGGGVRLLLPIINEDERYFTVLNPLMGRGVYPLLKVPKHDSKVAIAFSLASFI